MSTRCGHRRRRCSVRGASTPRTRVACCSSVASQSPLTTMHRSCATACLCVERHPLYPRESRGQSVRVGLLQHGLRRAVRVPGDAPPARRVAHGAGLRRARQRLSRLSAARSRLDGVRRRGVEPAATTVMLPEVALSLRRSALGPKALSWVEPGSGAPLPSWASEQKCTC